MTLRLRSGQGFSLWRISKRKYADTAFSGEGARRVGGRWNSRGQGMVYTSGTLSLAGARRVGGRWNSRGQGMVYTSGTLSLAALEVFVHMEVEAVGAMLAWIRVDVPTAVKIDYLEVAQLPLDWRNIPAPAILATLGDNWFQSGSTAILAVPSVVMPMPSVVMPIEYNYLVNPAHPDFARLSLGSPQPFELDPRLWKNN